MLDNTCNLIAALISDAGQSGSVTINDATNYALATGCDANDVRDAILILTAEGTEFAS
jgi:hypothetical protein